MTASGQHCFNICTTAGVATATHMAPTARDTPALLRRGKFQQTGMLGKTGNPSEPEHLSVLVCNSVQLGLLCKGYLTSATFLSWLMRNIPPEPLQSVHSLKERSSHTMTVCFLFLQLPEQGVPGSATQVTALGMSPAWHQLSQREWQGPEREDRAGKWGQQ